MLPEARASEGWFVGHSSWGRYEYGLTGNPLEIGQRRIRHASREVLRSAVATHMGGEQGGWGLSFQKLVEPDTTDVSVLSVGEAIPLGFSLPPSLPANISVIIPSLASTEF